MSDTPETDMIVRNAKIADHSPARLAATLTVKCEKLERERDEALMDRANGDIATMTRNHYERILQERDEVRKELAEYRSIAENIGAKKAVSEKEKAIRERDEAREIAEQAIEDLAWFNETNAQRLRNELEQLKEETK